MTRQDKPEPGRIPPLPADEKFAAQVDDDARRRLRARRRRENVIWQGLGSFGMVGFSVAIPTLLGVLLGLWLDATWPSAVPWTLLLLIAGLAIGSFSAWQWIERERRDIEADRRQERDGAIKKEAERPE